MKIDYNNHPPDAITAPRVGAAAPTRSKKRNQVKNILANSRRLRHRVALAVGLCVGLTTLLIGFE